MNRRTSISSTTTLVAAVVALAAVACDDDKRPETLAPQSRSQAVQATGPAAVAPAVAPAAAPSAPEKPRALLCDGQFERKSKDAPKASVARAGDKGRLSESLPIGEGHWTWINLWAAWCGPCKEELPRLASWEAKTAGQRTPLKVAFISLDDDARQLETFLGAQPAQGLHATYWLRDGQERNEWLQQAGMAGEPELPAHVLVDPLGKVRCRQQGAIEDADFAELLRILNGERG